MLLQSVFQNGEEVIKAIYPRLQKQSVSIQRTKKIFNMDFKKFKAATVQTSPVFLNVEKTVEKAITFH